MLEVLFSSPLQFLAWAAALVVAITVHEFSHALVADKLGDPTPRLQGRLTLNPLSHLDPLGTLMMLLVRFGWGKPVQFDPYNLKNPRRDAALISIAGPISNLLIATAIALLLRLVAGDQLAFSPFTSLALPFIIINIGLAVFNLIPIHPLDGGKIIVGILPPNDAYELDKFLNRYGMILLILLIIPLTGSSFISAVISPIINTIFTFLVPIPRFV